MAIQTQAHSRGQNPARFRFHHFSHDTTNPLKGLHRFYLQQNHPKLQTVVGLPSLILNFPWFWSLFFPSHRPHSLGNPAVGGASSCLTARVKRKTPSSRTSRWALARGIWRPGHLQAPGAPGRQVGGLGGWSSIQRRKGWPMTHMIPMEWDDRNPFYARNLHWDDLLPRKLSNLTMARP